MVSKAKRLETQPGATDKLLALNKRLSTLRASFKLLFDSTCEYVQQTQTCILKSSLIRQKRR